MTHEEGLFEVGASVVKLALLGALTIGASIVFFMVTYQVVYRAVRRALRETPARM